MNMLELEKKDGDEVRTAANCETTRDPILKKPPC
jgi:hypothetical protein